MRKNLPSIEAMRTAGYDPDSGRFARQNICSTTGYVYVSIGGQSLQAHRVAWAIHSGEWPKQQIDHIDGDRQNNRIENLRLATQTQNNWNMRVTSKSKSGIKGVYFDKERGKWAATICVHKRRINLGRFLCIDDAKAAYKAAAEKHFGEFARVA